jgi:hypothetical protein
MSVANGDHVRLTAVHTFNGQAQVQNVYDVVVTDTSGSPTVNLDFMEDAAAYMELVYSEVQAFTSNLLGYTEVRGFIVNKNEPLPTVPYPNLISGESTAEALPLGAAGLVLFRTSIARVVGRKYVGGIVASALADSFWTGGFMDALDAFGTAVRVGMGGEVNGSLATFGVFTTGGSLAPAVTHQAQVTPAYQRRRRQGRGV